MKHRVLLLTLALATLAGCKNVSTADVVGRVIAGAVTAAPARFLTEADEVKIGQQTKTEVLAQMPAFPNPDIRDYVTSIGQKMVAKTSRTNLPWEFYVVQTKEVNAFAAPGGFVFVTTGALRLMKNEAQLAGVLGHEVAHVDKKHSIKGIQQALVAQGILTGALQGNNSQIIDAASKVGATLVLKGWDRGAEEEADREGARFSYQNGYNPLELGGFLNTLAVTSGETPTWLVPITDHPRSDDRIKKLGEFTSKEGFNLEGTQINEAMFKMKVLDPLSGVVDPDPTPTPAPTEAPKGTVDNP
jgi:predicted Zn-dependent protease